MLEGSEREVPHYPSPEELWNLTFAEVNAWRKDLERRGLSGATIRAKLAALSSLFDHLCDANAVAQNPVKGVKRPKVESYEGKTPALGDHQARALLEAPDKDTIKGKRDRAILSLVRKWVRQRQARQALSKSDARLLPVTIEAGAIQTDVP